MIFEWIEHVPVGVLFHSASSVVMFHRFKDETDIVIFHVSSKGGESYFQDAVAYFKNVRFKGIKNNTKEDADDRYKQ